MCKYIHIQYIIYMRQTHGTSRIVLAIEMETIWRFPKMGVSQHGWFRRKAIEMDDDWGSLLLWKPMYMIPSGKQT